MYILRIFLECTIDTTTLKKTELSNSYSTIAVLVVPTSTWFHPKITELDLIISKFRILKWASANHGLGAKHASFLLATESCFLSVWWLTRRPPTSTRTGGGAEPCCTASRTTTRPTAGRRPSSPRSTRWAPLGNSPHIANLRPNNVHLVQFFLNQMYSKP